MEIVRRCGGEKCFANSAVMSFAGARKMTAAELSKSAQNDAQPPAGLSVEAEALWQARAGNWDAAHDLCQDVPGKAGAWIHALLHREEGDLGNAGYWYSRAGREMPGKGVSIEAEWLEMARELVG